MAYVVNCVVPSYAIYLFTLNTWKMFDLEPLQHYYIQKDGNNIVLSNLSDTNII